MSRFPFILSLIITSAVLSTPPSVRAKPHTYNVTAMINGGPSMGGVPSLLTYDTEGMRRAKNRRRA